MLHNSGVREHWESELAKLDTNNPKHQAEIQNLLHCLKTYNDSYNQNLDYFFDKYPNFEDITLLILKGHLLIEKQIRKFVFLHFANQDPFKQTKFEVSQVIALAEGFCDPNSEETMRLWACIKKLNKIRNYLSHQIDPKGIDDRIKDFIDSSWGFVQLSSIDPDNNEKLHDCIRSLHAKVLYLATT